MIRKIAAVIAGLAAAVVVITAAQFGSSKVYPPPPGVDLKDPEAMKTLVATMPAGAFALLLLAYVLGSATGGAVAALVAGRTVAWPSLVVGVLLTLAGVANLAAIPHPLWFAVVSTLLYVPFAYLGARVLAKPAATRSRT